MKLFSISTTKVQDQPQRKLLVRKPIVTGKINSKGVVYGIVGSTQSRTSFQPSEYNLGEISKVMDIEAYVRQAFGKHVELCLKEGYELSSRNEEATRYIKRRLREMAEVSGITFDSLVRSVIQNLVAYSNSFVVKARDYKTSSGKSIGRVDGYPLPPISAYFPLDPTSIQIKRNYHGKVLKYLQKVPGNPLAPEFKPQDIVHFYYDRKEGFAFGTPYIIPVLDDIRTLRRLEENVEMLITQHLFPLYQYIVGTEENPAEIYDDGSTEVDIIKEQVENMPTEGSIVTPERHSIKNLGAEGKALDASKYLDYFEERVLAGLGISEIALGRGGTANRNTASVIDKMMQDRCKDFQDVAENFVNEFILKELLYEGGFVIDESEDNFVKIKFKEIDIDSQIKAENHAVFKYEHDAITETELRELLGHDPVAEEQREDMYFERVTKPKAIIMAVDEPYTAEAKGASVQKVSKAEVKKRNTNNREQPENQHGKKIARTREKRDELLKDSINDIKNLIGERDKKENNAEENKIENKPYNPILADRLKKNILYHWDLTQKDVVDYIQQSFVEENRNFEDFKEENIKMILTMTREDIINNTLIYVLQALEDGIARAAKESGLNEIKLSVDPVYERDYLKSKVAEYVDQLIQDLKGSLVRSINPRASGKSKNDVLGNGILSTVNGVFRALEYEIDFISYDQIMKSYNFGYALAMRDVGHKELYLNVGKDTCDKCNAKKDYPIRLDYFSFEDIAPLHQKCRCTYGVQGRDK